MSARADSQLVPMGQALVDTAADRAVAVDLALSLPSEPSPGGPPGLSFGSATADRLIGPSSHLCCIITQTTVRLSRNETNNYCNNNNNDADDGISN